MTFDEKARLVKQLFVGAILFLTGAALRHWAEPIAVFIKGYARFIDGH